MARERFTPRDKKAHKMTRDGLVERNLTTGDEQRISQRGQEFDLRKTQPEQGASCNPPASVREALSGHNHAHNQRRQELASQTDSSLGQDPADPLRQEATDIRPSQQDSSFQHTEAPAHSAPEPFVSAPPRDARSDSISEPHRPRNHDAAQIYAQEAARRETADALPSRNNSRHDASEVPRATPADIPLHEGTGAPRIAEPLRVPASTPHDEARPPTAEGTGRLRFDDQAPATSGKKTQQRGTSYLRRFTEATTPTPESAHTDAHSPKDAPPPNKNPDDASHAASTASKPADGHSKRAASDGSASADSPKPPKGSKLKFAPEDQAPEPPGKKLTNARRKAERASEKLDAAKKKLPTKRKITLNKKYDAKKGKVRRKFKFEEEVKSQRAHLKGPLPLRPVKFGANAAVAYGHKKIYQVQNENVGVEAAHKGELVVEGTLRRAYRLYKTRPYRRVAKLQQKATKTAINHTYQQALHDNPKLRSNLLSRMMQKQKIKRQYAKAAREAKRAGKAAKKAGSLIGKALQAVGRFVARHPVVFGILALILLLIFLIMGFFSSCSNMATGGLSSVLGSSYLAEDADIDRAELSYTEWETDLQMQIDSAETTHSGYDEYRYNIGDIGHDPYELMAYLTVKYQNFSYAGVEAELRAIFAEQYNLSFVPEVEIRYADPNDSDDDGDYEPYEYHILNINLAARSFSDVVATRLNADQREINDILMTTKGNRQYIVNPFDFNWLPYVTSYYGWRVHPITGAKDYHKGVDIGVPIGTDILAGMDGTVAAVGYDASGYGHYVVIENDKGVQAKFAHCDQILATVGQEVKKTDVIAKSGNTGNSTGPHLHLEVLKNGQYLNPLFFSATGDDGTGRIPPGTPGGPAYSEYPGEPITSDALAAMIAEGEKHLGKKYVFGASGPKNFDCSGFVSWVLDKSGVHPMSRTNAQGIFNFCTPVSPEEAQPGDLIFFTGTYSTPNACSHIGIYVGNGQMLHCGDPVQYTSIETRYWRDHFYSFARLP